MLLRLKCSKASKRTNTNTLFFLAVAVINLVLSIAKWSFFMARDIFLATFGKMARFLITRPLKWGARHASRRKRAI